jgi:hypothetical protein
MSTLTRQSATQTELHYDHCLTLFQEDDSPDNEQALILAESELRKERRHRKEWEAKMLKELNKDLGQGRTKEQTHLSERLVHYALLGLSGIALYLILHWLLTHPVVAQ